MRNKVLYGAFIAGMVGVLTAGVVAMAKENDNTNMPSQMSDKAGMMETKDFLGGAQSLLNINPQGMVSFGNGKVIAASEGTITVEIWKISFSVQKMSDTKVTGMGNGTVVFSDIKVGDMVDVSGTIDTATVQLIHAKMIRDRSHNTQNTEQVSRLRKMIDELIAKLNDLLKKAGYPPVGSPTPTPSASATPSPSPSATPSPSPSASATPSPTPSPSPSASATPTPSPTAS